MVENAKALIKQDVKNGYNVTVQDIHITTSDAGASVVVEVVQSEHMQSVEDGIKMLTKTALNDENLDVEVRWE